MAKISGKGMAVIYDGHCTFCVRLARVLRGMDRGAALEFCDLHDKGALKEKFPMVKAEEAEAAMMVVTADDRVFRGFYAFRRLVLVTPWLWLLVPLFYLPGSSYLGTRLYSWVARNRGALGCRAPSKDRCR